MNATEAPEVAKKLRKKEYQRKWCKNNPEKRKRYRDNQREYMKKYSKEWHKKYGKDRRRFYKYGITRASFDNLLATQNFSCAICQSKNFGYQGPVVDHNHLTGETRGILCGRCNIALGQIKDNEETATRMASYIQKFNPKSNKETCK
jgi:hypothetical protein